MRIPLKSAVHSDDASRVCGVGRERFDFELFGVCFVKLCLGGAQFAHAFSLQLQAVCAVHLAATSQYTNRCGCDPITASRPPILPPQRRPCSRQLTCSPEMSPF
jgi:hypothetical protein